MSIRAGTNSNPPVTVTPYGASRGRFTAQLQPNGAIVVAAFGDLDATNADCFVDYALSHLDEQRPLVVDLRGLNFCGGEGFLAILKIRYHCRHHDVDWTLLPGEAIHRILEIGDPYCWLPTASSVADALDTSAMVASDTG
ncbi:MAG: STAS domain-containing protein [Mycobacterium sp.]